MEAAFTKVTLINLTQRMVPCMFDTFCKQMTQKIKNFVLLICLLQSSAVSDNILLRTASIKLIDEEVKFIVTGICSPF